MLNILFEKFFIFSGIVISIVGFGSYFLSVVFNKARPNVVTWIIWTIINFSVFFVQFSHNAGLACLVCGVSGLITFAIVILSFYKKYHHNVDGKDFAFLFLALSGLIIWHFASNALWAIIILLLVDICAYLPTVKNIFYHPFRENLLTFWMSILRNIFILLSLEKITFMTSCFQFESSLGNLFLIILSFIKRRQQANLNRINRKKNIKAFK